MFEALHIQQWMDLLTRNWKQGAIKANSKFLCKLSIRPETLIIVHGWCKNQTCGFPLSIQNTNWTVVEEKVEDFHNKVQWHGGKETFKELFKEAFLFRPTFVDPVMYLWYSICHQLFPFCYYLTRCYSLFTSVKWIIANW